MQPDLVFGVPTASGEEDSGTRETRDDSMKHVFVENTESLNS